MFMRLIAGLLSASIYIFSYGSYTDCVSSISDIECTLGQFSVLLFSLEKNVLHIERYYLDELAQDRARFSKKERDAHCLYKLHLGERGQSVSCIDWAQDMEKLTIATHRGHHTINYFLHWAALAIKEGGQLQESMKASAKIKEIFNIDGLDRVHHWTSLGITWTFEHHALAINLVLERAIKSVACAIVPTCLIDTINSTCVDMKKFELMQMGILTLMAS